MRSGRILKAAAIGALTALASVAMAKNSKPIVPTYVLQAHTVAVAIDPAASVSLDNPQANETARKDVETALANWGRFTTVLNPQTADMVIVLRKGNEKAVSETLPNSPQTSRPGGVNPTQGGIGVGAQHGQQPGLGEDTPIGSRGSAPQLEVGNTDDSFVVYAGNVDRPLDGPIGWRWMRKDALHPHDVPAVAEFKKAIENAEKQAAKQGAHP